MWGLHDIAVPRVFLCVDPVTEGHRPGLALPLRGPRPDGLQLDSLELRSWWCLPVLDEFEGVVGFDKLLGGLLLGGLGPW